MRVALISIGGLIFGIILGFLILSFSPKTLLSFEAVFDKSKTQSQPAQKQIIGFLPYWFVNKVPSDYSDYITTLTYFGLTVGRDGKIQYLLNEKEEEPGWHMLKSEKLQSMLKTAQKNGQILSLLVFSGEPDVIDELISSSSAHAKNLVTDVEPIMKKYGFSDLNLDIESIKLASDGARTQFTQFVKAVKTELDNKKLGTLTVEITGDDLIKKKLTNVKHVADIADYIVIMAYDFHYLGSSVTGAVAPIGGADTVAEFDTQIVLNQAYPLIPKEKIILGAPSYGYSWETLQDTPQSAVLPGSGVTVSNAKAEELLKTCATCRALWDKNAQESYVIYKDEETGTYHQLFFPNKESMQKKVDLVRDTNLAGLAIWAMGYENTAMLSPLKTYKTQIVDIIRL